MSEKQFFFGRRRERAWGAVFALNQFALLMNCSVSGEKRGQYQYDKIVTISNLKGIEGNNMRRIISIIAAVVGLTAFADPVARVTKVGEDPVVYDDLRTAILQCTNQLYKLDLLANVDLTGVDWSPIAFSGTFDGHGFTISNISASSTTDKVGFFSEIGSGDRDSEVRNLTLENVTVVAPGKENVGALVGYATGFISNVTVRGTIQVEGYKYVGGIVGRSYGSIRDCVVDGGSASVSSIAKNETSKAGYEVGGIVGMLPEGNNAVGGCTVKNLSIYGAQSDVGGIAGRAMYNAHIVGCTVENAAVIAAEGAAELYSGQIVGKSYETPSISPYCRFYINNSANNVTAPVAQLYGASATNMECVVIGTDVEGNTAGHVTNWYYTAGTFLSYGANVDELPLQVQTGYTVTKTAQRDGSVILHLAQASVAKANVYLDYDYQQASLNGVARYDVVKAGDTVSFSVSAKSGCKVDGVTVNGAAATATDGVYTYAVTADDVDASVEGGARGVTVKVLTSALANTVVLTIPNVDGLGKPVATYVDEDGVTQTPEVTKNATTGNWEVTVPVDADVKVTYPNPELGKKASPATSVVKAEDPDGDGKVTMTNVPTAVDDLVEVTIPNVDGLGKPTVTYVDAKGVTQMPAVTQDTTTKDWVVTVPNGAELTITYPDPTEGKKADPEETTLTVKDTDGDGKESVDADKLPKAVDAEGLPVNITGFDPIEENGETLFAITISNPLTGRDYYYRTATTIEGLKTAPQTKITDVPTATTLLFKVPRNPAEPQRFYEVLVK